MHLTEQHKKSLFLLLSAAILLLSFQSFIIYHKTTTPPGDPSLIATRVDSMIKYRTYYPFIHYEKNYVEWNNPDVISGFFSKVSQTGTRKLKILHIGDSHIQADIPSGYMRERLQDIFGYGGRGLVFPFKAAGTHAAYDYRTSCTGVWSYTCSIQKEARFDMGLIGATIHTNDSNASFKLVFREGFIRNNFTLVKIYCKQDSLSYDLKIKTSSESAPIHIDCNDYSSSKQYVAVKISKATDTLEVFVNKTEAKQNFFECYGLMIENNDENGVLYNSTGINGAGYRSLLKQRIFGKQLKELDPDLIIIDLGANDFSYRGYNDREMENNLTRILDTIRAAAPGASVLVSNAQDIYYRRKYDIVQCRDFMEMTKRVAKSHNCAFYNYFTVSGGQHSMDKWFRNGLARKDKVHLSAPGYYIRGELYLNALFNSYVYWLKNQKDSLVADKHIIDTLTLKRYFNEDVNFKTENKKTENHVVYSDEVIDNNDGKNIIYYKIRSGDNLGSIAERFGVKVSQIQYWNGISGSRIIAGETIVIYKNQGANTPAPVNQSATPANTTPVNNTATLPTSNRATTSRKTSYKVASGDSLWSIAKKYNTTVEKIKQANNLKSENLSVGQILLIP